MRKLFIDLDLRHGGESIRRVVDFDSLDATTTGPQGEDLIPMIEAEARKAEREAYMDAVIQEYQDFEARAARRRKVLGAYQALEEAVLAEQRAVRKKVRAEKRAALMARLEKR